MGEDSPPEFPPFPPKPCLRTIHYPNYSPGLVQVPDEECVMSGVGSHAWKGGPHPNGSPKSHNTLIPSLSIVGRVWDRDDAAQSRMFSLETTSKSTTDSTSQDQGINSTSPPSSSSIGGDTSVPTAPKAPGDQAHSQTAARESPELISQGAGTAASAGKLPKTRRKKK